MNTPTEPFKMDVDMEKLRKQSLFICVPMYGGMNHGPFMASCLTLTKLLIRYGIKHQFSFVFGESLVPRARNYLADEFMRSGCTHMLFIDSDIIFDARNVLDLLAMDRDVIGAPYPKKSLNWDNIRQTLQKHPEISNDDLERIASGFVFNLAGGNDGALHVSQPAEVLELGTGFMMVKREVYQQFTLQYPEQLYKPDNKATEQFNGSRYITAFFDCQIDRKRTVHSVMDDQTRECGGSDRYLSEDYFFCQWWRNMGGKIWLCPWMKLQHIGTYHFKGDLPAHADFLGKA